jgi:predicted DNA-binding transcriptional regulator AlpA
MFGARPVLAARKSMIVITKEILIMRHTTTIAEVDDCYLGSKQVRQRYADASDMWLWRRLKDDKAFPRPIIISGRRFWKLSELISWEIKKAAGAAT